MLTSSSSDDDDDDDLRPAFSRLSAAAPERTNCLQQADGQQEVTEPKHGKKSSVCMYKYTVMMLMIHDPSMYWFMFTVSEPTCLPAADQSINQHSRLLNAPRGPSQQTAVCADYTSWLVDAFIRCVRSQKNVLTTQTTVWKTILTSTL